MADGRSSLNSNFKAGKGGDAPEASEKKTMSYNQGTTRKESAGVEYGLSARENLDVMDSEPSYDYQKDPLTGNATERRKPTQDDAYSVSDKGKSFSIL